MSHILLGAAFGGVSMASLLYFQQYPTTRRMWAAFLVTSVVHSVIVAYAGR